jgi:hypothetical protein
MNLHLAEIAKAVAPAAHAILLVDQAGWHCVKVFVRRPSQMAALFVMGRHPKPSQTR